MLVIGVPWYKEVNQLLAAASRGAAGDIVRREWRPASVGTRTRLLLESRQRPLLKLLITNRPYRDHLRRVCAGSVFQVLAQS